jgi:hypothetical protein
MALLVVSTWLEAICGDTLAMELPVIKVFLGMTLFVMKPLVIIRGIYRSRKCVNSIPLRPYLTVHLTSSHYAVFISLSHSFHWRGFSHLLSRHSRGHALLKWILLLYIYA